MAKKLRVLFTLLTIITVALSGCQGSSETSGEEKAAYKYYTQDQLKTAIAEEQSVIIFDIQVEDDFEAHHIEGAIPTYAFPVKSDEEKGKIDAQFHVLEETDSDIVIICPKGRIGAERTFVYLLEKGIAEERLFILEGGQAGWKDDVGEINETESSVEVAPTEDVGETEASDDGG